MPFERLVEEEQSRRGKEGGGERQLLAHAVRVVGDEHAGGGVELHQLEQLAAALREGRRRDAVDAGDEGEVLHAGEAVEEREVLGHDADAPLHLHRLGEWVEAEDAHGAGGRAQQPGQALDGGRLAGAVGTEEAVEAPLGHGEVDAVDGDEVAEAARQAVCLQCQGHDGDPTRSRAAPGRRGRRRRAAAAARAHRAPRP